MMGMRGANWVGFVMLVILIFAAEPIWLFLGFDTPEFDSRRILWAIPVVAYVIAAVVLLIRGGPDRDLS
ncbi:MAG: hypothetical protein AB7L09_15870 [Nitrospira sp.]